MTSRFTPSLVFLPGSLCDERVFEHQKHYFEQTNPVYIISLNHQSSIEEMAEFVLATAPKEFVLIGFSMGGIVALQIMRMAPERVLGLALISTNAWQSSNEQIEARERYLTDVRTHGEIALASILNDLYPSGLADQDEKRSLMHELIKDMALSCGVDVFRKHWGAINARPDLSNMLNQIECPTLVLSGNQDVLSDPDKQQIIAQEIPNATLVSIDSCGHFCTIEAPALTTHAIETLVLSIKNSLKRSLQT